MDASEGGVGVRVRLVDECGRVGASARVVCGSKWARVSVRVVDECEGQSECVCGVWE